MQVRQHHPINPETRIARNGALLILVLALSGCAKAGLRPVSTDMDASGFDLLADLGPTPEGFGLDLSGDADFTPVDSGPYDAPAPDRSASDLVQADTCSPECAGKCKGADDGCGKPCPVNQCSGCCQGTACMTGTTTTACGSSGGQCKDCTYTHECVTGVCQAGVCGTQNKTLGTSCPGGRCYNGQCCKGCWDGTSCRGGISGTYCGSGGKACITCQTSNPCRTATCATGSCVLGQRPFGWGCPNGRCLHGNCCTGCISGGTCHPGNTNSFCGNWGGPCKSCWYPQSCLGGNCG